MLGWVLGACAIAGMTAPVAGQVGTFAAWPSKKWMAEESRASHADAHDEGVDIVYWFDDTEQQHWIYATGWVTEMEGGQVKGTRFATFRHDAINGPNNPTATAQAFFPSLAQLQPGDTYKRSIRSRATSTSPARARGPRARTISS